MSIVLFDGVCNLCNASVQFIAARDPQGKFQFASLQSKVARELLAGHGMVPPEGDPDSILLIEEGVVYERSTAALRIARRLSGPVRVLWLFIVVPRVLRDLVYRFVARHRYRWFGKSETCAVPTPSMRARFLD
ncbi:MAG: thiol-disulfide oxidoreductase DCC family protein [Polyangiales bacterium]